MKVLVTGCAGFIGAQVCGRLAADGWEVVGIDDMSDGYDTRLKDWRRDRLEESLNGRFRFTLLSIGDRDGLETLIEREGPFDGVVNLAARAGVRQSLMNPWLYFDTNVTGTLNLLDLCRRHGVPKLVLASTSSVYGDGERPFREDQPTDRPLSPYASSKKAAETLCYTYHRQFGLDVSVLRYFTVYGPAGRPDMSIFRFVRWIAEGEVLALYGDGTQERDFTFVDDIARGTVAALRPVGYEVINLGSDRPMSLLSVVHKLEEFVGREAKIDHQAPAPADVKATWASIDKARTLLDWEPSTSLEDGLRQAVDWYRANRALAAAVRLE